MLQVWNRIWNPFSIWKGASEPPGGWTSQRRLEERVWRLPPGTSWHLPAYNTVQTTIVKITLSLFWM